MTSTHCPACARRWDDPKHGDCCGAEPTPLMQAELRRLGIKIDPPRLKLMRRSVSTPWKPRQRGEQPPF